METLTFSRVTHAAFPALLPLFLIFRAEMPGLSIGMTRTETPLAPGPPVRTAVL